MVIELVVHSVTFQVLSRMVNKSYLLLLVQFIME